MDHNFDLLGPITSDFFPCSDFTSKIAYGSKFDFIKNSAYACYAISFDGGMKKFQLNLSISGLTWKLAKSSFLMIRFFYGEEPNINYSLYASVL